MSLNQSAGTPFLFFFADPSTTPSLDYSVVALQLFSDIFVRDPELLPASAYSATIMQRLEGLVCLSLRDSSSIVCTSSPDLSEIRTIFLCCLVSVEKIRYSGHQ